MLILESPKDGKDFSFLFMYEVNTLLCILYSLRKKLATAHYIVRLTSWNSIKMRSNSKKKNICKWIEIQLHVHIYSFCIVSTYQRTRADWHTGSQLFTYICWWCHYNVGLIQYSLDTGKMTESVILRYPVVKRSIALNYSFLSCI